MGVGLRAERWWVERLHGAVVAVSHKRSGDSHGVVVVEWRAGLVVVGRTGRRTSDGQADGQR